MGELGKFLRTERENKNLSLEDLQRRTKIRLRYLKAIENGDYEVIPGEVYLKGFLRSISRELELDYDSLMKNYYQQNNSGERDETHDQQSGEVSAEQSTTRDTIPKQGRDTIPKKGNQRSVIRWILLIIVCGLLLVAGYYLVNSGVFSVQADLPPDVNENLDLPSKEGTSPDIPAHPEPQEIDPKPQEPTVALDAQASTNSGRVYNVASQEIKLSVSVNDAAQQSSWIGISYNRGQDFFEEFTLNPGQQREYVFEQDITLRLGKADVVSLVVNSNDIHPSDFEYQNTEVEDVISFHFRID